MLATVAAALAACGGGAGADAGGGPDPATVVPPSAPLYMELAVKPEGERREDALAAARKVMRTDHPGAKLLDLIGDTLQSEDIDLDYKRDVEPWLGERVGVFVTSPETDEPPTLVAVAVTDTAKARSTVAALRRDAGFKLRTGRYHGVEYDVDGDGMASGVVGDFLVLADEPRFKQAVDASKGESLAESRAYESAIAKLDDRRVGTMYMTADTTFAPSGGDTAENRLLQDQMRQAFNLERVPPFAFGLVADGDRIAIEGEFALGGGSDAYRRLAELGSIAVPLVADAPADAWVAYGLPDLGGFTRTLLTTFAGGAGTAEVAASIQESTGLDLERDLLAWMGDAAMFVRGHDAATLDGALVVEAKDAGAARRALPKLTAALQRYVTDTKQEPMALEGADLALRLTPPYTDKPVVLAVGKGRMVAAYGEDAARAGLEPADRLGDTAEYKAVTESLADGLKPAIFFSMPGALKGLDTLAEGSDPAYAKVRPYLEVFAGIATGGRREGDRIEWVGAARLK